MRDDRLIELIREGLRLRRERPPEERFDDMVRRGVIDEQGRVLLLKGQTPPGETPEPEPPAASTNGPTTLESAPSQPTEPASD